MGLVHTLVAEVLGELIDSAEAAYDEALEVEFVGYTQVQGDVQGVMMGDEGAGSGTSGDALEDGGFHLEAAGGVEVLAHGGDYLGALHEGILHLRVDYKVHIALAVTHFRIGESIVHHAVHFLHYRKHAEALAQEGELLHVDAELTCLGDEGVALDSHHVADIEQALPDGIVHSLVLAGADFVALDVDLYAAGLVLQLGK